jgi:D-amino-acid dehydrogenase
VTTVVLGAGVIGVTTAYYLARDGHKVVVVERQPAAGLETSFANGALITPGMSDPWAAPGTPAMILTHLGREDSPFLLRLRALPGMIGWGLAFLANCAPGRWRTNTETIYRLGIYSRDAVDALTDSLKLSYDRGERGNLRVYQDKASLGKAAKTAALYRGLGLPVAVLDGNACVALEPALRPVRRQLAGGVHYIGDRSGDCLRFTQSLALHAARLGVEFRYDTTITGFEAEGGAVKAVMTNKGRIAGERFVLACGSYSTPLARQLGFRLPVEPVKGYSATLPVGGWNNAPTIPVVDYHRKMAVTRLGDRIRLAGTAEFAGYDKSPNPRRAAMLLAGFRQLFPEYPASGEAQHWTGLRPMCPDGRPILGRSPLPNLFLNTGHGPLGWSLACGSAKALADLMAGRLPEIDLSGFALERFGTA